MYRLVLSSITIIMITLGCGMKPISAPYHDRTIAKQPTVVVPQVSAQAHTLPKQHMMHAPVLPKEQLYSIHEYARFMYEEDCEELIFRKESLYERDIKQYALDTIDVLDKIQTNMKKYGCK